GPGSLRGPRQATPSVRRLLLAFGGQSRGSVGLVGRPRRPRRQHRSALFGAGWEDELSPRSVGTPPVRVGRPGRAGSRSPAGSRDPLPASSPIVSLARGRHPAASRKRRRRDRPGRAGLRGGRGACPGRGRKAVPFVRPRKAPLSRRGGVLLELPGGRGGDGRAPLSAGGTGRAPPHVRSVGPSHPGGDPGPRPGGGPDRAGGPWGCRDRAAQPRSVVAASPRGRRLLRGAGPPGRRPGREVGSPHRSGLCPPQGGAGRVEVTWSLDQFKQAMDGARARGEIVGLVPTMGDLHEGHALLIRTARDACGFVAVSIFV